MARSVSQREAARQRKARQRERDRERDRLTAEALAEQQEILDEHLAPAIRRHAIMAPSGRMIVGPRIMVIAGRASHADPVAGCRSSLITDRHKRAARQLQQDWHDVGTGVGVGAVDYLRSGGGGGGTGGHAAMMAQIDARTRLDAAAAFLGAFAPGIARVVLDCIPVSVFAAQTGRTVNDALVWLAAGLIRLAEFYWPPAPVGAREARTFVLGPARETYSTEVEIAA